MRRFNPERELYKIKYGKRNKIVLGIFLLLVIVSIGSTFALYQVRHSKRIIYTTVDDFSKDIQLAVFVDGVKQDDFPKKEEGKIYSKIECDNKEINAYWNNTEWGLILETKHKNKCNVYFISSSDTSGANVPELYQGLIPVTIDNNGTIKVADLSKEWYNYDEHEWANAVLVTNEKYNELVDSTGGLLETSKEKILNIDSDILQMYVWIPRYKYQLFNAKIGEVKEEQMIEIKFESGTETTGETRCEIASNGKETCIYDDNGNWYTHPAFTFGDKELEGFWVGKFEPSDSSNDNIVLNCNNDNCNDADNIRILPNRVSLGNSDISAYFYTSLSLNKNNNKFNIKKNEINSHLEKSIEWGAVAYLSQSKYGVCDGNGLCVRMVNNLNNDRYTGYANTEDKWNTTNGVKASTTGNIYGIYDMAGGNLDYTMANMVAENGVFNIGSSNFSSDSNIDIKYYDRYAMGNDILDFSRSHLGDAIRETLKTLGSETGHWYNEYSYFLFQNNNDNAPFLIRGGSMTDGDNAGIFTAGTFGYGGVTGTSSFRIVLTAQDGND